MKNKKSLIATLALTLTIGTVSLGVAHGPSQHNNQMGNHGTNGTMMHHQQATNLTPAQQQKVAAIEAKYASDFTTKRNAIQTKGAELDTAMNNGSTTLASLNDLRTELAGLEQEYWQLQQKVNQEISTQIGLTYYSNANWVNGNCKWHDSHQGNHMNGNTMMSGNMHQNCRW